MARPLEAGQTIRSLRKARKLLSALAGVSLILCPFPLAYGDAPGSARPIVIEGQDLEGLLDFPSKDLSLLRLEGQRTVPLPFQIDRRVCSQRGAEEICTYIVESATDPADRSTAPLGPKDELVFMARDAGECREDTEAASSSGAPFSGNPLEIRIENPDTKEQTCVYLGLGEADEQVVRHHEVDYDPALDAVTSQDYGVTFDPESPYFWKTISLKKGEERIMIFRDEGFLSEVSHAGSMVIYDIHRGDMRTELVGHRTGPIRVIRVTRNRLHVGPFVWKATLETGIFYRDQFHTTFHSGTYIHQRFLTDERERLFTRVAEGAEGWTWRDRSGRELGLIDRKTSPEEASVRAEDPPELILSGDEGTILYRLDCDPPGRQDRPLLRQPYLEEGRDSFASAGFCIPNLQDSSGPRHEFVKSMFFYPRDRDVGKADQEIPGPRTVKVWAGSKEIPQPGPTEYAEGGKDERGLRDACLRSTARKGPERRWGIVPVISAGPDKGLGAGVKFRHLGPLRPDHPLEARFLYSIYQYQIAEFWYSAEGVPFRQSGIRLTCNYYNKTRARFYGIGNDTDEADATDFRWTDLDLSLVLDHRLPHGFGLLLGWESRWGDIGDGQVSDLPGLEFVHPDLFGIEGRWSNGPVLGVYHTTLSPLHNPLSGGRQSFTLRLADDSLGTYTFQRYRLEAIQILPLPGFAHRLALRGQLQLMGGDPPFTLLSWVGGDDSARGYFEGRYRDSDRILLNAEYRCNLYKFLDGVLFLDTGRVADDLFRASPFKDLHLTGGFGMRFHLYPDIVVRFDVGFSSEMTAAYLNFGQAF